MNFQMKDFARSFRNINRKKKSEKRERKIFEWIQFPVEMKKARGVERPVSVTRALPIALRLISGKGHLGFPSEKMAFGGCQAFHSVPVCRWLQSQQPGKQICFLNSVRCAEYTDFSFLWIWSPMRLPCEQQELRTHFLQGEAATAVWAGALWARPRRSSRSFQVNVLPEGIV